MRQLKHHEQKLLKKTNFYEWKGDATIRESSVIKRYHIQDRDDYQKYNKIAGMITKLTAQLRKLPDDDPERINMTELLLEKLFSMGLVLKFKWNQFSLADPMILFWKSLARNCVFVLQPS